MEKVRKYIREMTAHQMQGTETGAILDDAALAAGKLLRPRLLLLCASAGPLYLKYRDRISLTAAMVELIHAASLIHDDIIDDAPLRRGKPSIQAKYGKDAAVYAGDFLISRVQQRLAREEMTDVSLILSETIEAMCLGEIHQTFCRYKTDITCDDYLKIVQGKTAALFSAACRLGAMGGGLCGPEVETMAEIGRILGILFQFRDDLADFTSTAETMGKETHKDFREGIYTIPILMALRSPQARLELHPLMQKNKEEILTDAQILQMEAAVEKYGGIEQTKKEIHGYACRIRELTWELKTCHTAEKIRGFADELDAVS